MVEVGIEWGTEGGSKVGRVNLETDKKVARNRQSERGRKSERERKILHIGKKSMK